MIEFNGKKVTKIMLGNKEIMSSGENIAEWWSEIKVGYELNTSTGKENKLYQSWIFPHFPIPNNVKKIIAIRIGAAAYDLYQICFYKSDMSFINGTAVNINNSSTTSINIPENAAFLKYSGMVGPLDLKFNK